MLDSIVVMPKQTPGPAPLMLFFCFCVAEIEVRCPPPPAVQHGHVTDHAGHVVSSRGSYACGGVVQYTCSAGHELSAHSSSGALTCQPSGTWDLPAPQCIPVCEHIDLSSNPHLPVSGILRVSETSQLHTSLSVSDLRCVILCGNNLSTQQQQECR